MAASTPLMADKAAQAPFTISQLAAEFGLTTRALRHYEDQGLIAPQRHGRARLYSSRDRARLALILRGKRVGLALSEIKEILDLYALGDGQHAQMRATRAVLLERAAALRAQRVDIDLALAELAQGLEWIEQRLTVPVLALVDVAIASAYDAEARRRLDE